MSTQAIAKYFKSLGISAQQHKVLVFVIAGLEVGDAELRVVVLWSESRASNRSELNSANTQREIVDEMLSVA